MTTPEKYRRPCSVLVLVHDPDRRILLLRRRDFGFWQSVTGSIGDDDTTVERAALREVLEETGLRARPSDLLTLGVRASFLVHPAMRKRFVPGVYHNTETQFSLQVPAASRVCLNPREHDAWRWLEPRQAREAMWSWSNRLALERLLAAHRNARAAPRIHHDRPPETG